VTPSSKRGGGLFRSNAYAAYRPATKPGSDETGTPTPCLKAATKACRPTSERAPYRAASESSDAT